jgi:hypothetical protein
MENFMFKYFKFTFFYFVKYYYFRRRKSWKRIYVF